MIACLLDAHHPRNVAEVRLQPFPVVATCTFRGAGAGDEWLTDTGCFLILYTLYKKRTLAASCCPQPSAILHCWHEFKFSEFPWKRGTFLPRRSLVGPCVSSASLGAGAAACAGEVFVRVVIEALAREMPIECSW